MQLILFVDRRLGYRALCRQKDTLSTVARPNQMHFKLKLPTYGFFAVITTCGKITVWKGKYQLRIRQTAHNLNVASRLEGKK